MALRVDEFLRLTPADCRNESIWLPDGDKVRPGLTVQLTTLDELSVAMAAGAAWKAAALRTSTTTGKDLSEPFITKVLQAAAADLGWQPPEDFRPTYGAHSLRRCVDLAAGIPRRYEKRERMDFLRMQAEATLARYCGH